MLPDVTYPLKVRVVNEPTTWLLSSAKLKGKEAVSYTHLTLPTILRV